MNQAQKNSGQLVNPAINQIEVPVGVGLSSLAAFEFTQRVAKVLSYSSLVPLQYRMWDEKAGKENSNGLANCIIALNMAARMGKDPLMVMQNLLTIDGKPSWSSQWIIACINESGRFKGELQYEIKELGQQTIDYTLYEWDKSQGKKMPKPAQISVVNMECTAWAISKTTGERVNGPKVSIEMAVKESWYTKAGSKWQTMPEVMLRYRAASFFGKSYISDLLLGFPSQDEVVDMKDINPEPEFSNYNTKDYSVIDEKTNNIIALPEFPDEKLSAEFPTWKKMIEEKKTTAPDLISKLSTKYTLTPEQTQKICDLTPKLPEVPENPPFDIQSKAVNSYENKSIDLFISQMDAAKNGDQA